ncbi:MAG: heme lyase CcmF/NrfE family subunit [Pseudomonadota bacterium]
MIPELGHFALVLAAGLAALLAGCALIGAWRQDQRLLRVIGAPVHGVTALVLVSFCALLHAFLVDDFSVAYVASNSNTALPWQFKVSALWGAHEGSFLLWTFIMALWTSAVAASGAEMPVQFKARVLGVMGLLNLGFLLFLLLASNPFERLLPLAPLDGGDLNPLLQDFGLIVHPPMLYTGYVGFSVAFAFAIAALLGGRMDATWARWARPWTNVAWAFLTLGIALGSWWAYYELGWGGWWFWDPVENASFMPWLVGTALIHSLSVTEKRGLFKSWTVLLALAAFSLSLLGAFIVRSGVLTSVHAFAVDPTRGLYILGFLVLVIGGSLLLYALRAPTLRSGARFGGLSRELMLLVNNLLLVVSMATVLFGTLAPIGYEALMDGAKISVGPPYFNKLFLPLMALLAVALGLSSMTLWKSTPRERVLGQALRLGALSAALGVVLPLIVVGAVTLPVALGLGLALWILITHGADAVRRLRAGRPPAAWWGQNIAHVGFAVSIIGVVLTSHYSFEKDLEMAPGQVLDAGGISVEFLGVARVQGPNYVADQGRFGVVEGGDYFELRPEKRRYGVRNQVMTEAAIEPGLLRDLYISLGEPLEGAAWAVRVQRKPFVRWVWLGALAMAFGGLLALGDARYRRLRARALGRRAAFAPQEAAA